MRGTFCDKCSREIEKPNRPLEVIVLIQRENGDEVKKKKMRLCTACATELIEWVEVMGHADV